MEIKLIDVMGDDLRVVNAARVSFDKESEYEVEADYDVVPCGLEVFSLSEKDQKLINYLASHNHWTPFSHVQITMREKVPIFVARQRFKHMVGFTYNEVSRRYVDDTPEFFTPDKWRARAVNKKQGSSDEEINSSWLNTEYPHHSDNFFEYEDVIEICSLLYQKMISEGVAPEQARMVLPQSLYTTYFVTGSLAAWARAYKLRSDEHSQREIQDLANMWNTEISKLENLKYSWSALTK